MLEQAPTKIRFTTYEVDPARLEHGTWCREQEQTIGEGDICASYSADQIALQGRIRRPFMLRGQWWVCVGMMSGESILAKAYKLTPLAVFNGLAQGYIEKTHDAEAARNDPDGFYHGITVTYRGETLVLTGPPIMMLPGKVSQQNLFT